MKKFLVSLNLSCDYEIEASSKNEAVFKALEYFDECMPKITVTNKTATKREERIDMSIVEMRAKLISEMNKYICDVIGDEDIIKIWLAVGVPDGSRYSDLINYARIEAVWLSIVNCFTNCLRQAGIIE